MSGDRLTFWVIYDHPLDYPEHFVLRRQHSMRDGTIQKEVTAITADSLETLRAKIPYGCVNLGRSKEDDPVIREVWI